MFQKFFSPFFPTGSLTTSTGTFLASATLSQPQLTFSGTSSSLSRPLKHLKASIDTLTASTDTLTASKGLSRPLQSTITQLACNREFTSSLLSTLMASTGIFKNSTTLTRPTLILMGPCKHSHSSATVSWKDLDPDPDPYL